MDYDKVQIVERKNFVTVMKPWSAFTAVDINNDNELETTEMERLFWMVEGKRPLISRLQHDMTEIDEDGSGTISRNEWLMYRVTPD